jgi:hypothetical protein
VKQRKSRKSQTETTHVTSVEVTWLKVNVNNVQRRQLKLSLKEKNVYMYQKMFEVREGNL